MMAAVTWSSVLLSLVVMSLYHMTHGFSQIKLVFVTDSSDIHTNSSIIAGQNITAQVLLQTIHLSDLTPLQLQHLICNEVQNGTVLVATDVPCDQLLLLVPYLDSVGVPVINVRQEDCYLPETVVSHQVLSYLDKAPDFSLALTDVLHLLNWDQFIVVYDESHVHYLEHINRMLVELNITAELMKIVNPEEDVPRLLNYVKEQQGGISKFMLACQIECLAKIFHQANLYDTDHDVQGLFTFHSQWLVVGLPHDSPLQILQDSVQDLDHVAVLVREGVQASTQVILQDIFSRLLDVSTTHLATLLEAINETTGCVMEKYNITGLIYSSFQDIESREVCLNCTEYTLLTAYYKEDRSRRFERVGEWSRVEYVSHGAVMPNLLYGFNGKNFLIATNVWDPFVVEDSNTTTGFSGLCISLLRELSINLNFTYDLILPEDGQWGIKSENGLWTGLVGQIEKKSVDLVVAPLAANVDREAVMDFTEAFFLEYQTVLVRYKDSEAEKWKLYLEPFEWQSWISFMAAIPLGALAIWLVTRLTPYYRHQGPASQVKATEGLGKLDNAMLFSFGSFFQQGSIWLPDSQSGRFIVGFWWMYCIVVMATYSGNLIAYLTVTKTELPFNSVNEMLAQDKFKFGIMAGTMSHNNMLKSRSGQDKALWDRIVEFEKEDPLVLSDDHSSHVNKVFSENYAYIQDQTSFELETSKRCDIGMIPETFQPLEYAIGLQNNSYYERTVSLEIIKIKETGLIHKWKVEIWPRQGFCSTGTQTNAKAVSLTDVQGAYYAMGILLGISCIVLLTEAIINLGKARKMTGTHSGGYGNSHVIQMNAVNGQQETTEVVNNNGFSPTDDHTPQNGEFQFTSMFTTSNSQSQLAPSY